MTPSAGAQPGWWRRDDLWLSIRRALQDQAAVDHHTHLLQTEGPPAEAMKGAPLGLRTEDPFIARSATAGASGRDGRVSAAGGSGDSGQGFWHSHLDATSTAVALVNQLTPDGIDGQRLRWVPHATPLLRPFSHGSANPGFAASVDRGRAELERRRVALGRNISDLTSYEELLADVLQLWQAEGAVALKFWDAYLRSLHFADVPRDRAEELYERGRAGELDADGQTALEDYVARWLFLRAGRCGLPVHFHTGAGAPPFLKLADADPRQLEPVLTDPALFGTQFVLIHAGWPEVAAAAYLATKPHVWADVSALGYWYPVPDIAAALRTLLLLSPTRILFGTDASHFPTIPGGAATHHRALSTKTREALYLALAELVRDEAVTLDEAVELGRGVLSENAFRLYDFS